MTIAALITHITDQREEADYWASIGEPNFSGITLTTRQADLLSDLLLEAAGITLITAANGRAVTDDLYSLAAALSGKDA